MNLKYLYINYQLLLFAIRAIVWLVQGYVLFKNSRHSSYVCLDVVVVKCMENMHFIRSGQFFIYFTKASFRDDVINYQTKLILREYEKNNTF